MTVATLQQLLEDKAKRRASRDANMAIDGIPLSNNASVSEIWATLSPADGVGARKVNTTYYHLVQPLKAALIEQLYEEYLKEETSDLLSACQRVRDLENQRDE